MSCGNPHATACTEVLSLTYVYIDGEIDEVHYLEVTTHLTECPPCQENYTAEIMLKARVRRSCEVTNAPEQLRDRIVTELRRVQVTYRQQ